MDETEKELQLVFDEASSLKKVQEELTDAQHTIRDMTETIQALKIENDDLRSYNRNLRSLVKILADENEQPLQSQPNEKETIPVKKTTKPSTHSPKQTVTSTQRKKKSKSVTLMTASPISPGSKKNPNILRHDEKIKSTKDNHSPSRTKIHRKMNPLAKESEETIQDKKLIECKQGHAKKWNGSHEWNVPLSKHKHSSVNAISTKAIRGSTTAGVSRMNAPSSSFSNLAKIESSIHGSDIVDIPLDIPLEFRPESASEPISVVTEASSYGSFSGENNE
jgi:regulator of replication initiation timing